MTITYNGETLNLAGWSKRTGISLSCLFMRVKRGWAPEQCLTVPYNRTKVSKNDAEMELNDTIRENLPKVLLDIVVREKYSSSKYGHFIRRWHQKEFDKWFDSEYLPSKQ